MDATAIIVAAFGSLGVSLTAIFTFIYQMKKLRSEEKQRSSERSEQQEKQFTELKDGITEELNNHRKEYMSEISKVKDSLNESNLAVSDLKASFQNYQALIELKLEYLTKEFNDMKVEVREHNNFAKRMPVVEEQIRVANHRISDLENKK